jgi:hypothetical protein
MKRIAIVSFAVCFLSANAALGQDAPPTPPSCTLNNLAVGADTLAAANEAMTLMGGADRMSATIELLMPVMANSIRKQTPGVSEETMAAFQTALREEMQKHVPEMMSQIACIYARHYTLAELKELSAFYGSPLGKKLVSSSSDIAKETLPVGMAWGMRVGTAAAEHVKEILRAKGMKI